MVSIGSDAVTGVCSSNPIFQAVDDSGKGIDGLDVDLKKVSQRRIAQGKTQFSNSGSGVIEILGAGNGDEVIISGTSDRGDYWKGYGTVVCSRVFTSLTAHPGVIRFEVSVLPQAPNQANVRIRALLQLISAPQVGFNQTDSLETKPISLIYESATQTYSGIITFNATLPMSGKLTINATDSNGQVLDELEINVSIGQALSNSASSVRSNDGRVEIVLPANAISTDGGVIVLREQTFAPIPGNLLLISGPYTINLQPGLALNQAATLSLGYSIGTFSNADFSHLKIFKLIGNQWIALDSSVNADFKTVSTSVTGFSTYAAMTIPLPNAPAPQPQPPAPAPQPSSREPVPPSNSISGIFKYNIPPRGDMVAFPFGRIIIPPGAVQTGATLEIRPLSSSQIPALLNRSYSLLGNVVEITIRNGNGRILTDFSATPLTLTFSYTDADLQRVSGDVNKLVIFRNPGQADEAIISTNRTVNASAHEISVTVTHLSTWGLAMPLGFVQQLFEQLGHLVMCGRIV